MNTNLYSASAENAVKQAFDFAERHHFGYVSSEHLLLGLLRCEDSVAASVLRTAGVNEKEAEDYILSAPRIFAEHDLQPVPTKKLSEILAYAEESVKERGGKHVCSENLLFALLEEQSAGVEGVLTYLCVDADEIGEELRRYIPAMKILIGEADTVGEKNYPFLDKYAKDLTKQAEEGKSARYVGTGDVCERILRVLCRKTKNNPCLVGEPGVGKTAAAEETARMIAAGEAPQELQNKRVYLLDLPLMLSGTKYRGDFEERIKGVVNDAKDPRVILFIDEIHTLIGAGSGEGSLDCANILKPALARGEIRVIGATTFYEYGKYIEKDQALERRFARISLREPDSAETRRILEGLKQDFEDFHRLTISKEALDSVVELSQKYCVDRFFPDKAIDLLDEACAVLRLNKTNPHDTLTKEDVLSAAVQSFGGRIAPTAEGGFDAETLSAKLREDVAGQDQAIQTIVDCLKRRTDEQKKRRAPQAVFVFHGREGSGRTHLARSLAARFYGKEDAFFEVDLASGGEKQGVSRLIGAEPGYIGYGEGGILSNRIRRNPFTLLLVKNYQFASGDVRSLFEKICEDGEILDGQGRKVSFGSCIVVFLSNERRQGRLRIGGFAAESTRENGDDQVDGELKSLCDAVVITVPPDDHALEALLNQTVRNINAKPDGLFLERLLEEAKQRKMKSFKEASAFFAEHIAENEKTASVRR